MDYINTYIERDIKDLAQVGKLNEFYDFLVYMAARTGQELKYSDIANAIGISAPTAKAWVSILERSGVIFILHPYYSNITKRLVKTPRYTSWIPALQRTCAAGPMQLPLRMAQWMVLSLKPMW